MQLDIVYYLLEYILYNRIIQIRTRHNCYVKTIASYNKSNKSKFWVQYFVSYARSVILCKFLVNSKSLLHYKVLYDSYNTIIKKIT